MAIGVVTDFGIMEIIVSAESPKSQPKATTETMAATLPARRPQVRGSQSSTSFWRCSKSGTASTTVAGPSRK